MVGWGAQRRAKHPQNHPGEQEGLKEPEATALCLGETLW